MRRITELDEVKKMELDILKFIHKTCQENNLKYFMAGGTLLGAVRHSGFIPWDDDIDILMYREDYEKLIKILNRKNRRYKVLSCNRGWTKDYYYPFARIIDSRTQIKLRDLIYIDGQGVFVDVFPIDGLPGKKEKNEKFFDFMAGYYKTWDRIRNAKNVSPVMINVNRKVSRFIAQSLNFIAKRYSVTDSEYIGCTVNGWGKREIMRKAVFEKRVLLDFEDMKFYGPAGYDEYLKKLYKNYMKLPPKSKRVHHAFAIWWKD